MNKEIGNTDFISQNVHFFLCHSHKDKKFVRRLARDLTEISITVWLDEWQLEIGDSLHECIGAALEKSAFVGVVLSPDSVKSRWCRAELDQALTREKRIGKKVVLPLLYRRVSMPPFLEGRSYLNFSKSYLRALTELAGILQGLDRKRLIQMLTKARPKNLVDVKLLLSTASGSSFRTVLIPEESYKNIRVILLEAGISISPDMFEVKSPLSLEELEHSLEIDGFNVMGIDRAFVDQNKLDILKNIDIGDSKIIYTKKPDSKNE